MIINVSVFLVSATDVLTRTGFLIRLSAPYQPSSIYHSIHTNISCISDTIQYNQIINHNKPLKLNHQNNPHQPRRPSSPNSPHAPRSLRRHSPPLTLLRLDVPTRRTRSIARLLGLRITRLGQGPLANLALHDRHVALDVRRERRVPGGCRAGFDVRHEGAALGGYHELDQGGGGDGFNEVGDESAGGRGDVGEVADFSGDGDVGQGASFILFFISIEIYLAIEVEWENTYRVSRRADQLMLALEAETEEGSCAVVDATRERRTGRRVEGFIFGWIVGLIGVVVRRE